MTEYLEGYDNILLQIYYEFYDFFYSAMRDSKGSEILHNIIINHRLIHIRLLADFFSHKRPQKDDVIYGDFLKEDKVLDVRISDSMRSYINKTTAHFTQKREKIEPLPDTEYIVAELMIADAIYRFIHEIDNGNIKDKYVSMQKDETLINVRQALLSEIVKFCITNRHLINKINHKGGYYGTERVSTSGGIFTLCGDGDADP